MGKFHLARSVKQPPYQFRSALYNVMEILNKTEIALGKTLMKVQLNLS